MFSFLLTGRRGVTFDLPSHAVVSRGLVLPLPTEEGGGRREEGGDRREATLGQNFQKSLSCLRLYLCENEAKYQSTLAFSYRFHLSTIKRSKTMKTTGIHSVLRENVTHPEIFFQFLGYYHTSFTNLSHHALFLPGLIQNLFQFLLRKAVSFAFV